MPRRTIKDAGVVDVVHDFDGAVLVLKHEHVVGSDEIGGWVWRRGPLEKPHPWVCPRAERRETIWYRDAEVADAVDAISTPQTLCGKSGPSSSSAGRRAPCATSISASPSARPRRRRRFTRSATRGPRRARWVRRGRWRSARPPRLRGPASAPTCRPSGSAIGRRRERDPHIAGGRSGRAVSVLRSIVRCPLSW